MGSFSSYDKERLEIMWRERGTAAAVLPTDAGKSEVVPGVTDHELLTNIGNNSHSAIDAALQGMDYLNITEVGEPSYTVTSEDQVLEVVRTNYGMCAILIPASGTVAGRSLLIKDTGRKSSFNRILVYADKPSLIELDAEFVIANSGCAVYLYCDGTDWRIA